MRKFSTLFLCAGILGVLGAPAQADSIKQGQWESQTQLWIDGKELLKQLSAAGDEIVKNARAQMPASERAQFDKEMAAARKDLNKDIECIGPKEAAKTPDEIAQESIGAVHQPPWQCSISDKKFAPDGFSYHYSCRTGGGGAADGTVALTLKATSYKFEIAGIANVVDGAGVAQGTTKMPVRSLTIGRWVGPVCADDEQDDDQTENNGTTLPTTKPKQP